MADIRFKLDRSGVGAILKGGDVRGLVARATTDVANAARTLTESEIVTRSGTTDRAVGQVVIAAPTGLAEQAENGVLTRAAAAAGLEVRAR